MNTPDLYGHYDAIRSDLLATGMVENMAESSSPSTEVWSNNIGFSWEGKDPNSLPLFGTVATTQDFGKTLGWQIKEGRDFSRDFATDSSAMILNEAAVKLTGIKNIVGKTIKWDTTPYRVVGVIKDMIMESPYTPVKPTIFIMNTSWANIITIRIKPTVSVRDALLKIEQVFKNIIPGLLSNTSSLMKNMPKNLRTNNGLVTLPHSLLFSPYLFPVLVYLDWLLLLQSNAPRKLV